MKYIQDSTGRFARRPYFSEKELNQECEQLVRDFLQEINGEVAFPISTDDLTKLIERDAADLDLYADLTDEGKDVEGMTEFYPGEEPRVKISEQIAAPSWAENRLRTTLTHEYGHVRYHTSLWEQKSAERNLFEESGPSDTARCNREDILEAPSTDWMEWQAGFVSGALLMPVGPVRKFVAQVFKQNDIWGTVHLHSNTARRLIKAVSSRFQVSDAAARVRLLQLNIITEQDPGPSLFTSSS